MPWLQTRNRKLGNCFLKNIGIILAIKNTTNSTGISQNFPVSRIGQKQFTEKVISKVLNRSIIVFTNDFWDFFMIMTIPFQIWCPLKSNQMFAKMTVMIIIHETSKIVQFSRLPKYFGARFLDIFHNCWQNGCFS